MAAVAAAIISREATSHTLVRKILYHQRTSSTLCSSGISPEAGNNDNRRDSKDNNGGSRGMAKMPTLVSSSGKCSPCYSSSSSLSALVCSPEASFRMALTTITACSALITTSSSLSATD